MGKEWNSVKCEIETEFEVSEEAATRFDSRTLKASGGCP